MAKRRYVARKNAGFGSIGEFRSALNNLVGGPLRQNPSQPARRNAPFHYGGGTFDTWEEVPPAIQQRILSSSVAPPSQVPPSGMTFMEGVPSRRQKAKKPKRDVEYKDPYTIIGRSVGGLPYVKPGLNSEQRKQLPAPVYENIFYDLGLFPDVAEKVLRALQAAGVADDHTGFVRDETKARQILAEVGGIQIGRSNPRRWSY